MFFDAAYAIGSLVSGFPTAVRQRAAPEGTAAPSDVAGDLDDGWQAPRVGRLLPGASVPTIHRAREGDADDAAQAQRLQRLAPPKAPLHPPGRPRASMRLVSEVVAELEKAAAAPQLEAFFARHIATSPPLPPRSAVPLIKDPLGRTFLHPDCMAQPQQALHHFAADVRQGRTGSVLEAHAFGDAFGRAVWLWREIPAAGWRSQCLYAGDATERYESPPLHLCSLGKARWGVFDPLQGALVLEALPGPDALYIALLHAAQLAHGPWPTDAPLRPCPDSVASVRAAISERLLGHAEQPLPVNRQRTLAKEVAKLCKFGSVEAYHPRCGDDDSVVLGPRGGPPTAEAVIDLVKLPEGWCLLRKPAGVEVTWQTVAAHATYFGDTSEAGLYSALTALAYSRWGANPKRHLDLLHEDAHCLPAHVAKLRPRPQPLPEPVPKQWYVDEVLAEGRRVLEQQPATAALDQAVHQFAVAYPYSPFRSPSEARVVCAYMDHVLALRRYAGDLVAAAVGEVFAAHVRIWTPTGGPRPGLELVSGKAHLVAQATRSIDIAHDGLHYQFLQTADCLTFDATEGFLPLAQVRAQRRLIEAGGGGDCLFLSLAYGLDTHGFRRVTLAVRRGQMGQALSLMRTALPCMPARVEQLSDQTIFSLYRDQVVRLLRQKVVQHWAQQIDSSQRGNEAAGRAVIDRLLAGSHDESAALLEQAEAWDWSAPRSPAALQVRRRQLDTLAAMLPDTDGVAMLRLQDLQAALIEAEHQLRLQVQRRARNTAEAARFLQRNASADSVEMMY
jgi:hypothetical protein